MCQTFTPWTVSETLAYGWVAMTPISFTCGRCYQLQFTGASTDGDLDVGAQALEGKTMIVQAVGMSDSSTGDFSLIVPGGRASDACAVPWGIDASELVTAWGGFLRSCLWDNDHDHALTTACVEQQCQSTFGDRGLTRLYDGCMWAVDWLQVAGRAHFLYAPIACPSTITERSGLSDPGPQL